MSVDRASVEEGLRLVAEATPGDRWSELAGNLEIDGSGTNASRLRYTFIGLGAANARYIAHVNPDHYAELARDWLRLKRVEEAARAFLTEDEAEAELIAALANPAAEEGE